MATASKTAARKTVRTSAGKAGAQAKSALKASVRDAAAPAAAPRVNGAKTAHANGAGSGDVAGRMTVPFCFALIVQPNDSLARWEKPEPALRMARSMT